MADCIFCKLANGEIPTTKIYEDGEFTVILDVNPATRGHCLILPKAHHADLYEMPEALLAKAHVLARKMAQRLTDATGCDGLNIVQNNKEAAGQTVFHYHIHLIPRYAGDSGLVLWKPGSLTEEGTKELLDALEGV